jgi:hypothetical protein
MTDEEKQLGQSIGAYFRAQRDARDDTSPLPFPAILADETANPVKQAEAQTEYVARLLGRKMLTETESKYLGAEIAKHLRGE